MPPVLAQVVRSGFVESLHRGHVAVVDSAGVTRLGIGQPERLYFPRSANKPLQAVAMVGLGLVAASDLIAVACGSHAGLPMHVDAVRRLLHSYGLDDGALDNTPDLPLDPTAAHALLASGGVADRVHQNCSGNHAAMVATCVARGWPVRGYLDSGHPLQVAIRETYEAMAGATSGHAAIDGCGAPLYALRLDGLARAYAQFTSDTASGPIADVAAAMCAHPDLVDGPGRSGTQLMASLPGLIAKGGAEGVYAAALPGGVGVAIKIEDGAGRACVPVLVAVLRQLGWPMDALDRWATLPVLGHGAIVGEVRATL